MDKEAVCKGDSAVAGGKWSFADRCKDYQTYRFDGDKTQSINSAIDAAQTAILARIVVDLANAAGNATAVAADLTAWQTSYNALNSRSTWAVNMTWSWKHVAKRDTSGDSCALPSKSQTASAESSTKASSEASTATDVKSEATRTTFSAQTSASTSDGSSSATDSTASSVSSHSATDVKATTTTSWSLFTLRSTAADDTGTETTS